MALTITSNISSGLNLSAPADNPLTITGGITVASAAGTAIYNSYPAYWTVSNSGVVTGSANTYTSGLVLSHGGTVTNNAGATIAGYQFGVEVASGSVVNSGTISASYTGVLETGTARLGSYQNPTTGVWTDRSAALYAASGDVSNSQTGVIDSTGVGVALAGLGTLVNAGQISSANTSSGTGFGVLLTSGGTVSNAGGTISGGSWGVIGIAGAAVTNQSKGTITGITGGGIYLSPGGYVLNQEGGTIQGHFVGVYAVNGAGTVTNQGLVVGTQAPAIYLFSGGELTNGQDGTIRGYNDGLFAKNAAGTITNQGLIEGTLGSAIGLGDGGYVNNETGGLVTGGYSGVSVVKALGTVLNQGTILSVTGFSTTQKYLIGGVLLVAGGSITNGQNAGITSTSYGVVVEAAAGTVLNAGSITSTRTDGGAGVALAAGGSVSNASTGTITSDFYSVELVNVAGTVTNTGSISTSLAGGGSGVILFAGGSVNNTGKITSDAYTVRALNTAAAVTNAGTIASYLKRYGAGVDLDVGGSITNSPGGLIAGEWVGVQLGHFNPSTADPRPLQGSLGSLTLVNQGSIVAADVLNNQTYVVGAAVWMYGAGTIINQAGGAIGVATNGTITGDGLWNGVTNGGFGIVAYYQTTLINYGSIGGASFAFDANNRNLALSINNLIELAPGASFGGVVKGAAAAGLSTLELLSGTSTGTISNIGTTVASGVYHLGYIDFAQVTINAGASWRLNGANTVAAGVTLNNSGTLTNAGMLTNAGTLTDSGTLTNAATISGGATLTGSGDLTNDAGALISASITATASNETISNLGTISGSVSLSGNDRLITGAGAVFGGAISGGTGSNTLEIATGPYALEDFDAAGTPQYTTLQIDNGVSLTIDASDTLTGVTLINAGTLNLTAFEPTAPVQNSGLITGDVTLTSGVPLTNEAGGTISGNGLAVIEALGPASVTNAGVIDTTAYGVDLTEGGTVTNTGPGASISGTIAGVLITGGAGTVITSGAIDGGPDAVTLAAGFANRVILEPGATFTGLVDGGDTIGASPASTLELASATGTLTGFGTEFINFAQILVDPNASWVLNGGSLASGVTLTDQGQLLVSGTTVTGGAVTIASTPGITASGTVSDGAWSGIGTLIVGGAGPGSFLVNNAGTAAASGLDAGANAAASGAITVTGTRSLLSNTGQFLIGDQGLGSLFISAGATVTTTAGATIANASGSSGSQVNITGPGSTLQVTGTLTVGNAGAGALTLDNGALTTAGALDAGAATTGDGSVSVTGAGTRLDVAGTITIGDAGSGLLSVLAGATVAAAGLSAGAQTNGSGQLAVSGTLLISGELDLGGADLGGYGELEIGPGGFVSAAAVAPGGGPVSVVLGTFDPAVDPIAAGTADPLQGGTIDVSGGFIMNEGTIVTDATKGGLAGQVHSVLRGTIVGGGTLTESGAFTYDGGPTGPGLLQIGAGSVLEIAGAVISGGTTAFADEGAPPTTYTVTDSVIEAQFLGASGILQLDDIGQFGGTVTSFSGGDEIVVRTGGTAGVDTLSGLVSNGNTLSFTDNGTVEAIVFGAAVGGAAIVNGDTIMACFAEGTRIGGVAVEDLRVGDRVPLAAGGFERIIWVGSRAVDCARHPRPETVWPVRVAAGAFGVGMPGRALFLSPDHAVFADGVLVPVRLLVNGGTIAQVRRRRVVYYHVELAEHAVILAEGMPCESYLDTGDRADFGSRTGVVRLFPAFGRGDTARLWETKGAAELVVAGERLERVRGNLTRAAVIARRA